jgi:hypothetical protein
MKGASELNDLLLEAQLADDFDHGPTQSPMEGLGLNDASPAVDHGRHDHRGATTAA